MKAKVLKYKFDCNTIVSQSREFRSSAEHAFISLARHTKNGNQSENVFNLNTQIQ